MPKKVKSDTAEVIFRTEDGKKHKVILQLGPGADEVEAMVFASTFAGKWPPPTGELRRLPFEQLEDEPGVADEVAGVGNPGDVLCFYCNGEWICVEG